MEIQINNCNNISEGTISIVENRLNIRYAINGTGKSTISKAIEAVPTNGTETTVTITKDTTENFTIKSGQNIVLDLNGKTLDLPIYGVQKNLTK